MITSRDRFPWGEVRIRLAANQMLMEQVLTSPSTTARWPLGPHLRKTKRTVIFTLPGPCLPPWSVCPTLLLVAGGWEIGAPATGGNAKPTNILLLCRLGWLSACRTGRHLWGRGCRWGGIPMVMSHLRGVVVQSERVAPAYSRFFDFR